MILNENNFLMQGTLKLQGASFVFIHTLEHQSQALRVTGILYLRSGRSMLWQTYDPLLRIQHSDSA